MGGEGRASVHDTTYDPLVEQNRCQVGPTILFECPAQIPRSSLRSFSLLGHARAFITTMVTNYVNTKLFLHVDSILALTIPHNV